MNSTRFHTRLREWSGAESLAWAAHHQKSTSRRESAGRASFPPSGVGASLAGMNPSGAQAIPRAFFSRRRKRWSLRVRLSRGIALGAPLGRLGLPEIGTQRQTIGGENRSKIDQVTKGQAKEKQVTKGQAKIDQEI